VFAVPVQGGSLRRICPAACMAKWSSDGTRFYVQQFLQGVRGDNAVVLAVPRRKALPDLPVQGIRSEDDSAALAGSTVIDMSRFNPSRFGSNVAPGPAIDTFAYARTIVHRNLFQIPLP
jgi:hypothetical protein